MHRFFVEHPIGGIGEMAVLSPEEGAHAARVLRLKPGEAIQLLDGERLYDAVLTEVSERGVTARTEAICPSPEPPVRVALLQGLPKGDKLELIAQKATELGAWELWPVVMERCAARMEQIPRLEKKRERIQRIVLEAAKQSGRAHVPQVLPVRGLAGALQAVADVEPAFDALFVPWEEERSLPLSRAVQAHVEAHGTPRRAAVVIGPEGGISREEWEALRGRGAVSVTLGPRILRTETAGVCALSVLWAALGEM